MCTDKCVVSFTDDVATVLGFFSGTLVVTYSRAVSGVRDQMLHIVLKFIYQMVGNKKCTNNFLCVRKRRAFKSKTHVLPILAFFFLVRGILLFLGARI